MQLATFLLESGGAEEARPILEGAVRFDSDHMAAHLNLGDCYRLLGSVADTDDAVQETLIRASRKMADFDPQRRAIKRIRGRHGAQPTGIIKILSDQDQQAAVPLEELLHAFVE